MPITVEWDDEQKTVVRWTISGELSWEDYRQASQVSREMAANVKGDTYTIFDATLIGRVPGNVLARLPSLEIDTPPNQRLSVVVSPKGFIKTAAQIFSSVYGGLTNATTLEEAREIIARDRQSRQQ